MTFGDAVALMRAGHQVRRAVLIIGLRMPDAHSENTLPYFYCTLPAGARTPWQPNSVEILTNDWQLYVKPAKRKPRKPKPSTNEPAVNS